MAPRIFFFLIFQFLFYFKYKTIKTNVRAFLPLNISAVSSVSYLICFSAMNSNIARNAGTRVRIHKIDRGPT